jgi:hypothetical protein
VELKDGSIQVAPQIIIEKEISVPEFSSAPSTPTTTIYPTSPLGQFQLMTGFFPTGGGSSSSNITSIFGRQGTVIGQIGDYTTDLVTEGANLYFTDTRAQNALSGSLTSLALDISTLSGILAVSSFSGVSSLQSTIDSVSGSLALLSTSFSTLSGDFQTLSGTVITIGNTLTSLSGSLA